MTTLRDLLNSGNYDCLLFGDFDIPCQFIWENVELLKDGQEHFKPILDLEAKVIRNGNIHVETKDDFELNRLLKEFVYGLAGYMSEEKWDRYFRFNY